MQPSALAAQQGLEGGAVVFLHPPSNRLLGVDLTVWKPPSSEDCFVVTGLFAGPHFVSWKNEPEEIKEGLMIWLSPRQVAVFEWDEELELYRLVRDQDELFRYQRGHDNLSLLQKSALYPAASAAPWHRLSGLISPSIIKLVQAPLVGATEEKLQAKMPDSIEHVDLDDFSREESLQQQIATSDVDKTDWQPLDWTDLPPSGRDLDTSGRLLRWIRETEVRVTAAEPYYDRQVLSALASKLSLTAAQVLWLGELQMAYIYFVLGGQLSAFHHWKSYYTVVPLANCIFDEYPKVAEHWMSILSSQLRQTPSDFILSDLTKGGFIVAAALDTLDYALDHQDANISSSAKDLKDTVEGVFKMSILELAQLQEDRFTVVDHCDTAL